MTHLQVKPVFVKTKNVRNFEVMMDGLELGAGEGRLGLVYGRAGRGKTRTAIWYNANHGCIYLRVATIWRTSELSFLRALCRELHINPPPHRKGTCYREIIDRLVNDPRPVFIDEIEKLPRSFLDVVRDLTDMTTAPFILIGEEELVPYMRRNRRVWSRTYRQVEYGPIGLPEIIFFAKETAGLQMTQAVGQILEQSSGGDFRIIKRDLLALVQYADANQTSEVTVEMARIAVKAGLTGK